MADGGTPPQQVEDFIAHWSKAEASERANAQPFLIGLAHILDVPVPSNSHADGYTFEFPVKIATGPDTVTEGRIDLYRRANFVLEAKQFAAVKDEPTELALALDPAAGKRKAGPVRGSDAWDDAMWKARGQAERYARHLPAGEPPAPFLLIVDVGHSSSGRICLRGGDRVTGSKGFTMKKSPRTRPAQSFSHPVNGQTRGVAQKVAEAVGDELIGGSGDGIHRGIVEYKITFRWREAGRLRQCAFSTNDRDLYPYSRYWSYVVSDRDRLDEKARNDLSKRGQKMMRDMARSALKPEHLKAIARAGVVEVSIPFEKESRGWAARVFPWEDVLPLVTRKLRGDAALIVVRHLDVKSEEQAHPGANEPPEPGRKLLFVSSAPKDLAELYSFDEEYELIRDALGTRTDAGENPDSEERLTTPTFGKLVRECKARKPDILHFAGVDAHQAAELLPESSLQSTGSVDGFVLKGSPDDYDLLTGPQCGKVLIGERKPTLVAFNCWHSGPRLAAMMVGAGARHAIGFQDCIGDAAAELFFAEFYAQWQLRGAGETLEAFKAAVEEMRRGSSARDSSGVVLWSGVSLLQKPGKAEKKSTAAAPEVKTTWTPQELRKAISVTVHPIPQLNYSMLHNNRSLLQTFTIRKLTPHDLPAIEAEISLHLGGADFPYRALLSLEGRVNDFKDRVSIPLVAPLFRECRESIKSSLLVELSCDGILVYRNTFSVELLSVDEWRDDPLDQRWLPSFVFPRDATVLTLIDVGARYLRAVLDDPCAGFDGYQQIQDGGDSAAIVEGQVRALWSAVAYDWRLTYINPPPTYTKASQRLRTPTQILESRSGTCIDVALLFASALEYVGIYPVIFMLAGHAFPGYWASEQARKRFLDDVINKPEPEDRKILRGQDDFEHGGLLSPDAEPWCLRLPPQLDLVAQCIAAGDLVPFESTLVTSPTGLAEAITAGKENAAGPDLECVVDIQYARDKAITPLPLTQYRP